MSNVLFLSVFTEGIGDMALNHLLSLKAAGITNTLSFCPSQTVVDFLNAKGFTSRLLELTNGLNKEFSFVEKGFNDFSYLRYKIVSELLSDYDYVWYMDVDTVVMRNPLEIFENMGAKANADVLFQDDLHMPCTGCMLIKNNNSAMKFVKSMWDERSNEVNDQMYLQNRIVTKDATLDLKIYILNIYEFVPGWALFDETFLVKLNGLTSDLRKSFHEELKNNPPRMPIFVHANFMLGSETKRQALKSRRLWFVA